MSNFVLERIKQQISRPLEASTLVDKEERVVEEKKIINPLSPQEIRDIFMPEQEAPVVSEDRVFDGIESFVSWYLPLKDSFTEAQNTALVTLLQMRDYINTGCGCKRDYRLGQANEYYKSFWSGNEKTDLPQKVKDVGGFKTVLFCVKQNYILQVS